MGIHGSLAEILSLLEWQRLQFELMCTRAVPGAKEHPLIVLSAVMKSAKVQGVAAAPMAFHVIGRSCLDLHIRVGERFAIEAIFCKTGREYVMRWRDALAAWLGSGSRANFALIEADEPERRSLASIDLPSADRDELRLDFLTPLPFERERSAPRTAITRDAFLEGLERRFRSLFGVTLGLAKRAPAFAVLPWYWRYVNFPHRSKSQPGEMYYNGCVGPLFLKGGVRPLLPLLGIAEEIHAGGQVAINPRGHFRLSREEARYFEPRFPDAARIERATGRVLERFDDAVTDLAGESGAPFDAGCFAAGLAHEIRTGEYRPEPAIASRIPKRDGSVRLIERPAFRDMVVQQYLNELLAPVFDRMFSPASVGYRRGYSVDLAAERVNSALAEGFRFVVEADIDDFFPTVDLARLDAKLDAVLPGGDRQLRAAIVASTRAGYRLDGIGHERLRGLSQGSALSPLLANLYLDAFDAEIARLDGRLVRYADDFVILTRTEAGAREVLARAGMALEGLGLKLDPAKTGIRRAEDGFTFLGRHFSGAAFGASEHSPEPPLRKPLFVTEPYLFLAVNGEALDLKRGDQLIDTIPLRRLSEIVVLCRCAFSSGLVQKCAALGIPLSMALDSAYRVTTLMPDSREYYRIATEQAIQHRALSEVDRLAVAKAIVEAKVRNHMALIASRYEPGTAEVLRGMDHRLMRMQESAHVTGVRGYEGILARIAFEALDRFIIDPAFRLERRGRENPDRINSLLNFGYYLLFARINTLVRAAGLNPYLGFLHEAGESYESLVCDIQEPFRASIERAVLRAVNLRIVQPGDFDATAKGMRLTGEARRRFVEQIERAMQGEVAPKLTLEQAIAAQVYSFRAYMTERRPLWLFRLDAKRRESPCAA